jgi:hypothetical protein
MGLDISCYEKVKLVTNLELADIGEEQREKLIHEYFEDEDSNDDLQLFIKNPSFPLSAPDFKDGFYTVSGDYHGFRAGSYGSYSRWRRDLAKMTGIDDIEKFWDEAYIDNGACVLRHPFGELLNFSDCEGVIAGEPVRKLAAGFGDWAIKAEQYYGEFDVPKYVLKTLAQIWNDWATGTLIASNGGILHFH